MNVYRSAACVPSRPYAIVNNQRVFAKTPEDALEKIRTKIEEELAIYAE